MLAHQHSTSKHKQL